MEGVFRGKKRGGFMNDHELRDCSNGTEGRQTTRCRSRRPRISPAENGGPVYFRAQLTRVHPNRFPE
jgi:hypothetical protein